MENAIITYDVLPSLGDLFIRFIIKRGDQKVFDVVVNACVQDDLQQLPIKAAEAAGVDPEVMEQEISTIVINERGRWLKEKDQQQNLEGFHGQFTSLAELQGKDLKHRWLIKGISVRGQPAILGGPKKSLKTSLVLDAAISLATGKPFLGRFEVPEPVKVAVLSGESGDITIRETALRIAKAKHINASACSNLLFGFELPRLNNDVDLNLLRGALLDNKVDVVFIDPAYLCLLDGSVGVQTSNMFHIGPLLLRVARLCSEIGTTLILVHHTTKQGNMNRSLTGEPMDLEDLAYAGFQEFARQWVLINRRQSYEQGSGKHALWLNIGGSAGHSGCWGIDIDEGTLGDDFRERRWVVRVISMDDARQSAAQEKENKKAAASGAKKIEIKDKVIGAIRSFPMGETTKAIAEAAGLQPRVVGPILAELRNNRAVMPVTITKSSGRGKRDYEGWRHYMAAEQTVNGVEQKVLADQRHRQLEALGQPDEEEAELKS